MTGSITGQKIVLFDTMFSTIKINNNLINTIKYEYNLQFNFLLKMWIWEICWN